jgi:hypothetical protein
MIRWNVFFKVEKVEQTASSAPDPQGKRNASKQAEHKAYEQICSQTHDVHASDGDATYQMPSGYQMPSKERASDGERASAAAPNDSNGAEGLPPAQATVRIFIKEIWPPPLGPKSDDSPRPRTRALTPCQPTAARVQRRPARATSHSGQDRATDEIPGRQRLHVAAPCR